MRAVGPRNLLAAVKRKAFSSFVLCVTLAINCARCTTGHGNEANSFAQCKSTTSFKINCRGTTAKGCPTSIGRSRITGRDLIMSMCSASGRFQDWRVSWRNGIRQPSGFSRKTQVRIPATGTTASRARSVRRRNSCWRSPCSSNASRQFATEP